MATRKRPAKAKPAPEPAAPPPEPPSMPEGPPKRPVPDNALGITDHATYAVYFDYLAVGTVYGDSFLLDVFQAPDKPDDIRVYRRDFTTDEGGMIASVGP